MSASSGHDLRNLSFRIPSEELKLGNEQYAKEMGEYLGNTVISAIENM